jgi:hypothetical protein
LHGNRDSNPKFLIQRQMLREGVAVSSASLPHDLVTVTPQLLATGQGIRQDYEDERRGARNLFLAVAPLMGCRRSEREPAGRVV